MVDMVDRVGIRRMKGKLPSLLAMGANGRIFGGSRTLVGAHRGRSSVRPANTKVGTTNTNHGGLRNE